jgi:FlaG/FlaF family flagellin (archaellin)
VRDTREYYQATQRQGAGGRSFERLLNEQPLIVGVVAVLIGALIAFILPRTRREDALIGQRSDQFVGRVKEVAGATLESVKETASKELSGLVEGAKEAAHKTAEQAAEAAQKTAQQATETAEQELDRRGAQRNTN